MKRQNAPRLCNEVCSLKNVPGDHVLHFKRAACQLLYYLQTPHRSVLYTAFPLMQIDNVQIWAQDDFTI